MKLKLIVALILVAGVVAVAGRERPAAEPEKERAPQQAVAAADDDIDLERLRRGEAQLPRNDPFAGMRSAEPKQVAAVPSEPAKPTAPTLPFQYIGKWSRGEKGEVLVMRDQELLAIAPGQKIGEYRVDQISESKISFTYLPLKAKQSLDLTERKAAASQPAVSEPAAPRPAVSEPATPRPENTAQPENRSRS
jgi:hypothetical protein